MTVPVPDAISELVRKFDTAKDYYKSKEYNETDTRSEFIDRFFEALGWDVTNSKGVRPEMRDVFLENTIRADDTFTDSIANIVGKRPDYSLRVGGKRKFYVEAKKPFEQLDTNKAHAFQVRAYGWSTNLPLSILTDFEEFIVYDCRVKPDNKDSALVARLPKFSLTYDQYADRWEDLYNLLSYSAVEAGSLEQFAATNVPSGSIPVDRAFLAEISEWRSTLAEDIAAHNGNLSSDDLNYAVQMTINRIIFLRMCEDRGIERPERLKAALVVASIGEGENKRVAQGYAYRELIGRFVEADRLYNSGMFHFHDERDVHEEADSLTLNLKVSDEVLESIIQKLYYPYPYKFDVIPIEILGQVYEQFLGKVIVRTGPKSVDVQDKPEVRKAGGVYYTPTYIVDYIVKNTVERLLEGKTTDQASKLRVLDPACGSGSFLIGACQHLLDWHLAQYTRDEGEADRLSKKRKERPIAKVQIDTPQGKVWAYRLTLHERKRILKNNIYGVDIDRQAVEVTKLSLLLKVLEGNLDTNRDQLKLELDERERILPDLGDNIKCGNSLIEPSMEQSSMMPDDDLRRINAFDWKGQNGFAPVMQEGGFDAVIGNPPYIRIQAMKEWAPIEVELYKHRYKAATKGNYDIYVVFVEKGLSLLNEHGTLGFILPHKFFNAQYGEPLRGIIASGKHLSQVVHFGDQQVFAGATTYTCLMFLDKGGSEQFEVLKVGDLDIWRRNGAGTVGIFSATSIDRAEWNFRIGSAMPILTRLGAMTTKLSDIAHLFVGLQTDADDVFILEEITREGTKVLCKSKSTAREHWLEDDHLKPFLNSTLYKNERG
jgi:hypothetical protein